MSNNGNSRIFRQKKTKKLFLVPFWQKRQKMEMVYIYIHCPIVHSSNLPVLRTHNVYQCQIALLRLLFRTYKVTRYFKNGVYFSFLISSLKDSLDRCCSCWLKKKKITALRLERRDVVNNIKPLGSGTFWRTSQPLIRNELWSKRFHPLPPQTEVTSPTSLAN